MEGDGSTSPTCSHGRCTEPCVGGRCKPAGVDTDTSSVCAGGRCTEPCTGGRCKPVSDGTAVCRDKSCLTAVSDGTAVCRDKSCLAAVLNGTAVCRDKSCLTADESEHTCNNGRFVNGRCKPEHYLTVRYPLTYLELTATPPRGL